MENGKFGYGVGHGTKGFENTSIGKVWVGGFSSDYLVKIINDNNIDLRNISPQDFTKLIARYACYFSVNSKDEYTDNDFQQLSNSELNSLIVIDFERIAEKFIERSRELFREVHEMPVKDDDGSVDYIVTYGEVITPKKVNENFQSYLLRLAKVAFISHKELNSVFSKQIQEDIKISKSEAAIIKGSIKNIQNKTYTQKNTELITKRFEELVTLIGNSSKFMIRANELQTAIAEEIKKSSYVSTRLSKRNILIGLVVLLVSTMSFVYSIYTVKVSNSSNSVLVEKITSKLDSINLSIKSASEKVINADEKYENLIMKIDSLRLIIK